MSNKSSRAVSKRPTAGRTRTRSRKSRQTGNTGAPATAAPTATTTTTAPNDANQSLDEPSDAAGVINVLIEVADNTRENAYAPYSGYRVGAALLTSQGNVYSGCNVENASYGISMCAERAAVVKAVSEGERDFEAIAVVTEDGSTPCGACRQFLREFGADIAVILADRHGRYRVTSVGELLPAAFVLNSD